MAQTESLHVAVAESRRTLALLHLEADALSRKGLCQDDFEWYAQRLTELEQHLAYLLHLEGLVLAVVPFVPQVPTVGAYDEEIAAYKEPASCACCDALLEGYADGTTRWCSEACMEEGTAPPYWNHR
jgi:hypothetical protein